MTVRFVDIGGIVDRHCLYKYCHTGPATKCGGVILSCS